MSPRVEDRRVRNGGGRNGGGRNGVNKTAEEEAYVQARIQAALELMAKEQEAQATNKPADVAKANRAAGGFFAGLKRAATSKPALIGAIALALAGGAAAYKTGYLSKAQAAIFEKLGKLTGGSGSGAPATNAAEAAKKFFQNAQVDAAAKAAANAAAKAAANAAARAAANAAARAAANAARPSLLRRAGEGALSLTGSTLGAAGRGALSLGGSALGAAGRGVVSATWHPKTYAALAGTGAYLAHKYKNRERDPENSYVKHILRHAKRDLSSTSLARKIGETTEAYKKRVAKTAEALRKTQGIINNVGAGLGAAISGMKATTGAARQGARAAASGVKKVGNYLRRNNTTFAKTTGVLRTAAEVMKNPVKSFAGGLLFKTKGGENAGQKAWGPHAHDARARQNAQKLMTNPAFVAALLQRSAAG